MTVAISTSGTQAEITASRAPVDLEALEAAFTRIHARTRSLPAAERREVDQAVGQVLDGLQTLLSGKAESARASSLRRTA